VLTENDGVRRCLIASGLGMVETVVPAVNLGAQWQHGHDEPSLRTVFQPTHILTEVAYTSTAYLCILHYGRLLGVDKQLSCCCSSPCSFEPPGNLPPSFERFPPAWPCRRSLSMVLSPLVPLVLLLRLTAGRGNPMKRPLASTPLPTARRPILRPLTTGKAH
jgi:hypothetical protein